MKDDPDEARLPWTVEEDWTDEIIDADGQCVAKVMKPLGRGSGTGFGARFIVKTVNGLATAPPAILLAASAADAEVLRAESTNMRCLDEDHFEELDGLSQALARARILDASTHVCLSRAEVEALFRSLARGEIYIDEFVGKFNRLSRETGKGEE